MNYVIVDLEATCWRERYNPSRMEIIEIGAVMLASSTGPTVREFVEFIRPVEEPILSDFCTELTSIRQSDVDSAETFPSAFSRFVEWIGDEPYALGSWGAYDLRQFKLDCQRHNVPCPPEFDLHINIKEEFARLRNCERCGMDRALKHLGLKLEGTHHRGIDDARNIARIALTILPQLERENSVLQR